MKRAAWHLRVGAVVAVWLVAFVALSISKVFQSIEPWLIVHVLLFGAVSNAILLWSRHFADALLRLPENDRRRSEGARLALFNGGALVVIVGKVENSDRGIECGAAIVIGVVVWHVFALFSRMGRARSSRFLTTLHYYVAASILLIVGVILGVGMTSASAGRFSHSQLELAHIVINLLGWIALTVIGTLVSFWPTMLRTRIAKGAETAARTALPVLLLALGISVVAVFVDSRPAAAAGVVVYLFGTVVAARPLIEESRARPPTTYATRSVLAAQVWFVGSVTALAVILAVAPSWEQAVGAADRLLLALLIGFALQVVLGALSFLVPVVLGGGPAAARATNTVIDIGGVARLGAINGGLVVATLPLPAPLQMLGDLLVATSVAGFLALLVRAVLIHRTVTRPSDSTAP